MTHDLEKLVFRRNARQRRGLSGTGWAILLVGVFVLTALIVFAVSMNARRDIASLSTPLPQTLQPTAVSWPLEKQVLPGGTQVYTASEAAKREAVSAFLEAWKTTSFEGGLPEAAGTPALLAQHFWPEGPAYRAALQAIGTARQAGAYWRRAITGPISLSRLVEFSESGEEAHFSLGLPAGSTYSELIDVRSGQVLAARATDTALTVAMRYDTVVRRWLVYEIQATK